MKKRVLAVLLAAGMVIGLAACGNSGGSTAETSAQTTAAETDGADTPAAETEDADTNAADTQAAEESSGAAGQFALDGTWPAETVKIGVVAFDVTDEQFLQLQMYYEDLTNNFNMEFMYSESIASAEDELKFIENCAAAGCDAVIGYYNVTETEAAQLCQEKGIYYWTPGQMAELDEKIADYPYYLGSPANGDADYENGYALAKALIDQGATKIVYASGGDEMGVDMFIKRFNGFQAAVDEADGVEIVHKVPGWPGTDSFTAEQTAVLDMDFDALASSFSAAVWFQPLASAGKLDGSLKIATMGNVSDVYLDAMNEGTVSVIIYECEEVSFGSAIPMILNAVTDHMDLNRTEDGQATNFSIPRWVIDSADTYNTIYEKHEANEWFVTAEDIANCLGDYNPDASYNTLSDTYSTLDVDAAMSK